ncbi:MAG: NAD(P)/FAD-dependent oxidoreductase [Spirochaetales bacterium]|nr:NAD(P)/FAD-dependent oxidoreductase [Spirochaetales bacterium]
MNYDVIIIGAGIVGGAVARELSRYRLSVLCLEKEEDVCCGVSKGNTGIVHSPALVPFGTKKARLSLKGRQQFDKLSRELGFEYQKTGALVLAYSEHDLDVLTSYIANAENSYRQAGILPPDYRIFKGAELFEQEPDLNPEVTSALLVPDTGRIIPYEYGIALIENAVSNGLHLKLGQRVHSARREGELWRVETDSEFFSGRFVINAAGHGSNELGLAAGFPDTPIKRVKGQYLIFDRDADVEVNHILFQVPSKADKHKGKGILVTKTVYGNLMIGPDAVGQGEAEDTSTDIESTIAVINGARLSIPGIDIRKAIKSFAGVRPRPECGDFIIQSERGFVHLCGIESPGLTSSPAIAEEVVARLGAEGLSLQVKDGFRACRDAIVERVLSLDKIELKRRIELAEDDPERLLCRCEQVPQSRVVEAISRGIPVTTIDGVKRRTRAGQGRCQGAFCTSRVRKLLAGNTGLPEESITQRGRESSPLRIDLKELRKLS